jgi:hypothetical protein
MEDFKKQNTMKHYRLIILAFLQVCLSGISNGQTSINLGRERISSDSIYLLDISVYQKLNVLEKYKDSVSTPFIFIDFPYSNYHTDTKTLSILHKKYSVPKTAIAIIRVERSMDPSYGSGGSGYLMPIDKKDRSKNFVIDSIIRIDSVSHIGTFYLTINNESIQFQKNTSFLFVDHKQMKTDQLSYDIITEYSIFNFGYIRRRFKQGY